ncbi:hypothetical protein [Nocardia sp. NPDC004711]
MFRTLAELVPHTAPYRDRANAVLAVHPLQLSRWLEEVWAQGGIAAPSWAAILGASGTPPVPLGDPQAVAKTATPADLLATMLSGVKPTVPAPGQSGTPLQPYTGRPGLGIGATPPPVWEHLMYAYLVEATGVFEILGEVARRYLVGETLSTPSIDAMVWVRNTEQLFYSDPPVFNVGGLLTSQLRPDARTNRRNAYWRMFNMDLPHPIGRGVQGQPWKRDVGPTGNARFLEFWNELLRQVWMGIENDRNTSGPNPTDSSYIGYLCQTLSEMLQLRRRGGMLSREEFAYVTMLSWFHLTIDQDTAVVRDLHADTGATGNPADRLATIGARVGIAPSRQSRELFELADLVSTLMWSIELGLFNANTQGELLYRSRGVSNPVIAKTMNRLIDLWQSGTGERVKDLSVTSRRPTDARTAQPTRLPGGLVPTAKPSTNGHRAQPLRRP